MELFEYIQNCQIILERNWWEAAAMVDNRERECFRRWMWFIVNLRLMRTLRYSRESPSVKGYRLVRTTHPKRIFDDWIRHIATYSDLHADFLPLFFETFSVTTRSRNNLKVAKPVISP